ncbi:MAG: AgmX/PglI C-terminal domain-containing protein [Minicystis sp.]
MSMPLLVQTFREAGPVAWIIVPAGVAGALGGLVALILAVFRPAPAFRWGGMAAVLGILCAGLGAVGVAQVRAATESALVRGEVSPIDAEPLRRDGYREARSAAALGLTGAAIPLLTGITAMFAGRRRKAAGEAPGGEGEAHDREREAHDRRREEAPRPGLVWPIVATALGMVSSGFAVAALSAPLPARSVAVEDVAFRDMVEAILDTEDATATLLACDRLEISFVHEPRGSVRNLQAAAKRCVDAAVAHAVVQSPLYRVRHELESIATSSIVRRYPELGVAVRADLDEVERMIAEAQERPWELDQHARFAPAQVRMGQATVDGPLPADVVERIVRQNFRRLRYCYESGLTERRDLAGHVSVRFVIGRNGAISAVRDGGSDVPDRTFVACVMRAFEGLSFPQPEGATVAVTYPLVFSPG